MRIESHRRTLEEEEEEEEEEGEEEEDEGRKTKGRYCEATKDSGYGE